MVVMVRKNFGVRMKVFFEACYESCRNDIEVYIKKGVDSFVTVFLSIEKKDI